MSSLDSPMFPPLHCGLGSLSRQQSEDICRADLICFHCPLLPVIYCVAYPCVGIFCLFFFSSRRENSFSIILQWLEAKVLLCIFETVGTGLFWVTAFRSLPLGGNVRQQRCFSEQCKAFLNSFKRHVKLYLWYCFGHTSLFCWAPFYSYVCYSGIFTSA